MYIKIFTDFTNYQTTPFLRKHINTERLLTDSEGVSMLTFVRLITLYTFLSRQMQNSRPGKRFL